MGCGGSRPDGLDGQPLTGGDKLGTAGGAGKQSSPRTGPVRREGYSSGKRPTYGGAAALAAQQPSAPKSASDLQQLRTACSSLVLFSSMTTEQQDAIFSLMFEVSARAGRRSAHDAPHRNGALLLTHLALSALPRAGPLHKGRAYY